MSEEGDAKMRAASQRQSVGEESGRDQAVKRDFKYPDRRMAHRAGNGIIGDGKGQDGDDGNANPGQRAPDCFKPFGETFLHVWPPRLEPERDTAPGFRDARYCTFSSS